MEQKNIFISISLRENLFYELCPLKARDSVPYPSWEWSAKFVGGTVHSCIHVYLCKAISKMFFFINGWVFLFAQRASNIRLSAQFPESTKTVNIFP